MIQIIQTLLAIIGVITLCFLTVTLLYAIFKLGMRVWDKIDNL